MNRRNFIAAAVAATAAAGASRGLFASGESESPAGGAMIKKTSAEWRELLGDARYKVLFEEATERPWTSPLNDEKRAGTYVCAACNQPLFLSSTKFDSGTGWPSFYQPIADATRTKTDFKLIFPRTEYHCSRCGGHQGHVFNDGPEPTGQRWCNNGLALRFVPEGETLPELLS